MEITTYNLTYIFLILMQKFLDFKAKIVRSKRESQRVDQEDIIYLIRRYQHIKTIKKNRGETQNIQNKLKFSSLQKAQKDKEQVRELRQPSDENQIEIDLPFEKQQSTLQSVNSSSPQKSPNKIYTPTLFSNSSKQRQSFHLSNKQRFLPLFQITKSKHRMSTYTETNFKPVEYRNKISQNENIHHKNRIYEDLDEKVNPAKKYSIEEHLTTRQMLQLDPDNGLGLIEDIPLFKGSKIRKIQHRFPELNSHVYQQKINRFDEDKIEMLFREEYKEFFLSSLSSIPNREDESLNTLKSQFQFSNQFQQSSQEKQKKKTSNFDKIWGFFNQKENNKFLSNTFHQQKKKPTRQKVINIQQKSIISQKLKEQARKLSKNDKKQDRKLKKRVHSLKK